MDTQEIKENLEQMVDKALPLGLLPVPAYVATNLIPPFNTRNECLISPYAGDEAILPFIFPKPFDTISTEQIEQILRLASIRQIPTFEKGNPFDRTIPKKPQDRFKAYRPNNSKNIFVPCSYDSPDAVKLIDGIYGSSMMGRSIGINPEITEKLGLSMPSTIRNYNLCYINQPRYTINIKGTGSNSDYEINPHASDPEGYVRINNLAGELRVLQRLCYPDDSIEVKDLYGNKRYYPEENLWIPYRSIVALCPVYKIGNTNLLKIEYDEDERSGNPFRFNYFIGGTGSLTGKAWDIPDALYVAVYLNQGYDLTFNDYFRIARGIRKLDDPIEAVSTTEKVIRDLCIDLGSNPFFYDMFTLQEFEQTHSEDFLRLFLSRFYIRELEKVWLETSIDYAYGLETNLDNHENRAPGKGRKDYEGDHVKGIAAKRQPWQDKFYGIFRDGANKSSPVENVFYFRMKFVNQFIMALFQNILSSNEIIELVTSGILEKTTNIDELATSAGNLPMVNKVLRSLENILNPESET